MRKNIYKLIALGFVISICLLLTNSAKAQTKWSLEQCVTHAIENNIQIKQQALNVNYNENQLKQSKFNLAPDLNSSLGHSFDFGRSTKSDNTIVNENSQTSRFGIESNVMLFNGLAKQNTIKQREFQLQSAIKDLEKTKDDISLAVVSAYLEILFNKELVASTKEQITVTNQQIDYNKKQVEAGNMAKGKLYETESQLANEELTLTNYENQLQLSILNLVQLLELEDIDGFDIVIPEFDASLLNAGLLNSNEVFEKAVTERPEIISKELALKGIEYEKKIAKAMLYPSLSASASLSNFYNNKYQRYIDPDNPGMGTEDIPFADQLDINSHKAIGLYLRIPIFNGWSVKTNIANSHISYQNSKHELQLTKNNLLKEIQQVHLNAVSAMKKYYSSEKAVESTSEAYRYVEEKFNLGIVTPLEYNDAKNKVTNAQSSFIQAKYEYIFRVKILDFYNGKEIVL